MRKFNHFKSTYVQKKIKDAIVSAELQTSAEIVPMIVKSSIATEHVRPLLTCLILIPATALYFNLDLFQLYPLRPWMVIVLIFLVCLLLGHLGSKSKKI